MFPPPVNPSELVDERHPALKQFLRRQVDMQIADLRVLFQLPVDELGPNVGCNFTAAAMIFNLISGFSVWFYATEQADRIQKDEANRGSPLSGRRFKGFVEEYWPTNIPPEPDTAVHLAKVLYEIRNSLAHALGATDEPGRPEPREIGLAKQPSETLEDIVHGYELNLAHPMTVPVVEEKDEIYVVHLGGLYWAMHHMLRRALHEQADRIERVVAETVFPEFTALTD